MGYGEGRATSKARCSWLVLVSVSVLGLVLGLVLVLVFSDARGYLNYDGGTLLYILKRPQLPCSRYIH